MTKILIGLPCMDSVPTSFMQSLINLDTDIPDASVDVTVIQNTLIDIARNQISESAIAGDYDYLCYIDSDMTFDADLLKRLLESIRDKDFITGLYFGRRPPYRPQICSHISAEVVNGEIHPDTKQYWDYPEDSMFQIEACGFGACLINVDMLAKLWEQFGMPFCPAFGFGEDYSFCLRAKQAGYKLYCDSTIKLGHVMHTVVDEQMYKVSRSLRGA